MPVRLQSQVKKKENVPSIVLDGEYAMMNTEKGKYYGLDSVASRIWELLDEQKTVDSLIELLLTEYEVKRSTCENDVIEFLEKLNQEGLILVVD